MALGGLLEGRGHAKTRAQKHACNAKADEQETAAALSIKTINDNDNDNDNDSQGTSGGPGFRLCEDTKENTFVRMRWGS